MKIIQIKITNWTGADGKVRDEIIGLGDDSLIYKWHMGSGQWVLNVFNK